MAFLIKFAQSNRIHLYISDQICLITLIWLGNYLACSAGHEFRDTCRWLENHPVWYEIHPQIVVFPLSRLFSGVYDQWLYHRIFHHWGEFSSSKTSFRRLSWHFFIIVPQNIENRPKKSATSQPAMFFLPSIRRTYLSKLQTPGALHFTAWLVIWSPTWPLKGQKFCKMVTFFS